MTLFLFLFVIILMVFVIYLIYELNSASENHSVKIKQLQEVIFQLIKEQKIHSSHLKLSEELKFNLHKARITLDKNILDLQHDLFSKIAAKK